MRNQTVVAIGFAGICALCAPPSQAQTSYAHSPHASRIARAVELEDRAVELHAQPSRAYEAAQLHKQSAALRGPDDPEAVQSLAMAAHLLGYADRPLDARRTMEQAAERALAMGDVVRAAAAYTEAAFFAQKANNTDELNRLGHKAIVLASSPLLRPDQREAIMSRFLTGPSLAVRIR